MTDNDIDIKVWIGEGGMLVNAYALNYDHPMHPYNQIVAMGKIPEHYGIEHPLTEEFKNKRRPQLIEEIVSLRKELTACHMHMASL